MKGSKIEVEPVRRMTDVIGESCRLGIALQGLNELELWGEITRAWLYMNAWI